LKAGADNIADVFNVTGKSMAEIQATLSPEEFAEFQEAMKKNTEAVKASLGVQQPAIQKYKETQEKLAQAVKDDIISKEEAASASRKAREDLMSAVGVTRTPFQEFSGAIDNIAESFGMVGKPLDEVRASLKGNAADLALFDKAVKNARDNLLSSLGIEKSPQQVFEESMKKIEEAANSTDKDKRITQEQAAEARRNAERKRDEALGAGNNPQALADQAAKRKKEIEEAYGVGGSKDPEKYRMAMDELGKSLPGAEEESPVQKFKDQMSQLRTMRADGTINQDEFAQRQMQLQAQLQEDTKESVDAMRPDRRGIEASDNRSKAGVDTFFRILRGGDNPSLKAQLDTAKHTKRLAELAEEPDAAPVIQNIQGR
jgi:hypothetical protein